MKLESLFMDNSTDHCVWNEIFNDEERNTLQNGFLLTGLLSVMSCAWLSVSLLCTSIRHDRSYRNLANFTLIACIRRALPLLLYLPLVKWIETLYGFQKFWCEVLAFWETFLAVFEVEYLTHVCIERYVLAKYVINGWQVKQSHYNLYFNLCFFFSCLYSIPPLFGVGRYGFDFQCTSCTFDVILPTTWLKYPVVVIFALRSIKPTVVMVLMLIWARTLENKLSSSMKHHKHFTQSVIIITLLNLLCWTPIAMIRGSILVSQMVSEDLVMMTSGYYVTWAMWLHWVAPALTVIALFLVDDRVRHNFLHLSAPEAQTDINKID